MRLYVGSSELFIEDTVQNRIAEKLKEAFFSHFRYQPSPSGIQAWRNSLRAIAQVFDRADLSDHGVILEYQLPMTSKRLDCLICGRSPSNEDNAVIIELKQWERCEPAVGEMAVLTRTGGGLREVLHPSVQVGQYQMYLEDGHTAFYDENAIKLAACSYLHNYQVEEGDFLLAEKFREPLAKYPLFSSTQVDDLTGFLKAKLDGGGGMEVLTRIEESKFRPSKKLMEHVANVIKGKPAYVLLDEQLVVYDRVLATARQAQGKDRKTVIIIKGGPGTGKSVIAINLMADLLMQGFNAHYATGSKAFTETLRKVIGARGSVQFKYFNSYTEAGPNEIDVLIADEAHRIRETSANRFTPAKKRKGIPQIEELFKVAKTNVFFIDDAQVVRPNEIGSVSYIKEQAAKHKAEVLEYELEAQFRCSGSNSFVNWIDNTLGIRRTANVIWDQKAETFDFKIFGTAQDLDDAIMAKFNSGASARMTAGFCWKWSNPRADGSLPEDVIVGDYRRPWDAKPGAKGLAKNIPPASLWAHDPNGIGQVGCVYTAQGFEFDYVGVIFGPDLTYSFDSQAWEGHREKSADQVVKRSKEQFLELVKATYRVLLTRGMKGCYVHFLDKDTERFFRSRTE